MSTPIDPTRLARAVHLDLRRMDRGRYLISGGSDNHVVAIQDGRVLCDCPDAIRHGDGCKHSLRVRLAEGDDVAVLGLRELVPAPSRARQRKVRAA